MPSPACWPCSRRRPTSLSWRRWSSGKSYRLLTGSTAALMQYIASQDGSLARVSRAIGWIKSHYREPLTMEALAEHAGMSPSSLHAHFKSVTRLNPLHYRAQLRLQKPAG
ncbi:MAG: TetR family transcriptional regulator [Reyranella sp.]